MAHSPTTSLSLLDRLRGPDPGPWSRLHDLYAPLLRAWLAGRGLQPADVDDLCQNALAVVVRRVGEFRHNGRPGAFRTWLRGVAGNVLRDHLRAAGRRPDRGASFLAEVEDAGSPLSRWWDAEHDRHVLRGLMNLVRLEFARETWAAFTRTALDGRPTAEVAAELGLTPNAVHVARSRVLARLRQEAEGMVEVE
ncbi:MAG: sigma-70 family RNA polymerase sigma factor [Gemmataceae bacterium]|nr:sigma-70 family RNA polymerase sigma factor [Gemmataceae bacterium]